jgi:hypothetical protein
MRTMMRVSMLTAFLVVLAVATGCEDTPLTAGKDFKMTVVANPSTVDFGPGDTNIDVQVFATIVNDASVPQSGITVLFTSSSSTSLLESDGQGQPTDGSGTARDVLHVHDNAPASITVTATSGALTKTVAVTKTASGICADNTAPTAAINPPGDQTLPAKTTSPTVSASDVFGTSSFDDETAAGSLTYLWDCGGGTSPSLTDNHVICTYTYGTTTVTRTITLTVTDDGLPGHTECRLASTPASLDVTVPGAP